MCIYSDIYLTIDIGDVWRYRNGIWAWISGDVRADEPQSVPGICEKPGMWSDKNKIAGISQYSSWTKNNEMWLFGGQVYTTKGDVGT